VEKPVSAAAIRALSSVGPPRKSLTNAVSTGDLRLDDTNERARAVAFSAFLRVTFPGDAREADHQIGRVLEGPETRARQRSAAAEHRGQASLSNQC
jgi:hypothetical protein